MEGKLVKILRRLNNLNISWKKLKNRKLTTVQMQIKLKQFKHYQSINLEGNSEIELGASSKIKS